jgi:spermidine synthase
MLLKRLLTVLLTGIGLWVQADTGPASRVVTYQERSLYRNIMVVEGLGYRCITFGKLSGEQSCIKLSNPGQLAVSYTKGLMSAFLAVNEPSKVLVIGLGGGVVPRAIRAMYPAVQIDTVELDPAVVKVAKTHFGFTEDERLKSYVSDGRMFVRQQRRAGIKYDIVFVDAMERDYIPEHLLTQEFMTEMSEILTVGGVLVANTFTKGALQAYELATYRIAFKQLYIFDLDSGNRIIMAGRDLPTIAAMHKNAQGLNAALGSVGVSATWVFSALNLNVPPDSVRPLTDQYSPSNLLMFYAPGATSKASR